MRSIRWSGALLAVLATAAQAQQSAPLTPLKYFNCQIAAREATLQGVDERAALLARNATPAAQSQAAERSRMRVEHAFMACGYSPVRLAAYAHREADAIQSWLAHSPATQAKLDALGTRLAQASARMPASQQRTAPQAQ